MSVVEQDIVDALKTRLQSIRIAGGYYSDIGTNVNVWRDRTFPESDLPAINFRDVEIEPGEFLTQAGNTVSDYIMTVEISVLGKNNDTDEKLRQYAADVDRAIGTDPTFGGLVHYTLPGGVRAAQVNREFISGERVMEFNIKYRRGIWG